MKDVDKAVQQLLKEGQTPIEVRTALVQQGFLEDEVDKTLNEKTRKESSSTQRRTNRLLSTKESFDRLGYGFASPQFINILFFQSGAGFFMIGVFNGLKTILSLLFSSTLQEYMKHHTIPKNKIADAGLLFGFSFFVMAFAALAQFPWLFAAGFLLGSLGIVTYGDLYMTLARSMLKHEKRSHFLKKAVFYGVIISGASLIVSGLLIDSFQGTNVTIGAIDLQIHGFLLSFMITAFAFILGSYIMSKLPDLREKKSFLFRTFFREHTQKIFRNTRRFMTNPYVFLLLVPATLAGLLQILGASFYGIYIFQEFEYELLGGFTNVAVLYAVALIASLFGPSFTRLVQNSTGLAPHLVFGTLLTAILPFILVYNPYFFAVMAALVCSVIGAAITGMAQGMIAQKIMDLKSRKAFFITQSFIVAIPYLLLIPVGSWIASAYGLETLFKIIAAGLVFVVVPLYFFLVIITNKIRL